MRNSTVRLPIPSMDGVLTARLSFRTVSMSDKEWWMEYHNDARAIKFMPFTLGSTDDLRAFIQRTLDRYAEDGSGLNTIVVRETEKPIGMIGLVTQLVGGVPELEIGYHLVPSAWGNGYATEAAIACREFAREYDLASSVISLIDPQNLSSQNVAKRIGMIFERDTIHRGSAAMVFRYHFY